MKYFGVILDKEFIGGSICSSTHKKVSDSYRAITVTGLKYGAVVWREHTHRRTDSAVLDGVQGLFLSDAL